MADIYKRDTLPLETLDPDRTIVHWRVLHGREKSQKEINDERLRAWRARYDVHVSMSNWHKYHQLSKVI